MRFWCWSRAHVSSLLTLRSAPQAVAWYHDTVTISLQIGGEEQTFVTTRTATLLSNDECRPETETQAALCVETGLQELIPGSPLDNALFDAGAAAFSFTFFALLAAVPTLVMMGAGLFTRTDKLPWKARGRLPILIGNGAVFLCSMIAFASYAGVVTGVPDDPIRSMRFGFGFGLIIIVWMVSLLNVGIAFKFFEDKDLKMGTKPEPKASKMPKLPRMTKTANPVAAGATAGAGGAAAPAARDALPPGWEQVIDPETGDTYYWNPNTNMTTWERPTDSVRAGVAAARGQ